MSSNVICMIQARMDSQRFPGKVLKEINGIPIISLIVKRVSNAKNISKIIVVTSDSNEDDILCEYLKNEKIEFFRGNKNNVLSRFYQAAKKFNADFIIRLTGDNPFVDSDIVNQIVSECLKGKYDYVSNDLERTFPFGLDVEILRFNTLEKISEKTSNPAELEHVTLFIRNNPQLFSIKNISAPVNLRHPEWRLTIDEFDDLKLIQKIVDISSDPFLSYERIVDILQRNPDLVSINKNIRQKIPDQAHKN